MGRFIMRYRGQGPTPPEDSDRIRALPNTTVLDESSPRMLLVEGPEAELRALVDAMPSWAMAGERMIPVPDARPRPRQDA